MSVTPRYKTHRGKEFNMTAFAEKNGDVRAVGNASMNARGDIIDSKGNVKIPNQVISRASANLKNNDSSTVSLKADAEIKNTAPTGAPVSAGPTIVGTRDIVTEEGTSTEIEYSDGSIQVVPKSAPTPTSL
jgi:hypothetical protein